VSTKLTSYSKSALSVTPDYYAAAALSRCTSGANAGVLKHDLAVALVQCISDVFPLSLIMGIVAKFASKAAERVKQRE